MCDFGENATSCGIGGNCIVGVCTCSPGWFTSSEFVFMHNLSPEASDPLVCDGNYSLLVVIYILLLLLGLSGIIGYSLAIRRWSQFKRLIPFWIGQLCTLIVSIYKLFNLETGHAESILLTFFDACLVFLYFLAVQIFMNKYISYHYRTLRIKNRLFKNEVQVIEKIGLAVILLAFFSALLFLSVPIISRLNPVDIGLVLQGDIKMIEKEHLKKRALKTSFGLFALATLYQEVSTMLIVSNMLKDVKKLKKSKPKKIITSLKVLLILTSIIQTTVFLCFLIPILSDDL